MYRNVSKDDTPILTGYQIYHDYLRPHEGLEGKTPAEACGIKVEGDKKWLTIIKNASHQPKVDSSSVKPNQPKT